MNREMGPSEREKGKWLDKELKITFGGVVSIGSSDRERK